MTDIDEPIDENTLTGDVRVRVSSARDAGHPVDQHITCALAIADLLQLPDETIFIPAVTAAMQTEFLDALRERGPPPSRQARTKTTRASGALPSCLPGRC
jgi:hypothetical protein